MAHVVRARSAYVCAFQEQVREAVQAQASGEGADEAIQAP